MFFAPLPQELRFIREGKLELPFYSEIESNESAVVGGAFQELHEALRSNPVQVERDEQVLARKLKTGGYVYVNDPAYIKEKFGDACQLQPLPVTSSCGACDLQHNAP